MREPQTKLINGNEWNVTPWHGMLGVRIQAKLSSVLTPAILSGQSSDTKALIDAMSGLLDEDELPKFMLRLLHGTTVNGVDVSNESKFNEHFQGNFAELYKGLAFVFKVNFEDFSELAGGIMSQLQPFVSGMMAKQAKAKKPAAKQSFRKG